MWCVGMLGQSTIRFPELNSRKFLIILWFYTNKSRKAVKFVFFFIFLSLIELALTLPFHWMIKHKNNAKGTIYRSDFVDSQIKKTEEIRQRRARKKTHNKNVNCVRKTILLSITIGTIT